MRRIFSIIVFVSALLLLQGCMVGNRYTYGYYTGGRVNTAPATSQSQTRIPPHRTDIHIVTKGETLYSIAFAYGEDVRSVAEWNHIRPPYTIYPNEQIRLTPPPVYHAAPARIAIAKAAPPASHTAVKPRIRVTKSNTSKSVTKQKISWQWPTNGKIISTYSATDVGKKGIDIAGQAGQPIFAAAGGEVVYSGNGLRGYGKLIIIKHNDSYFSAYAHNRRILVKDDQQVKKGQQIADMGSTESDRPMLHFEVRRDGKPVDPLQYLPRKH